MRSGFALLELLVGLVLAALIAAIATPQLVALSDAAAVRDEALRVVAALDAARGASVRLGVVATLALTDTSYSVAATVATDRVTAWQQPGPRYRGVTLGGAGQPITFGPDGLSMGVANRTLTISKGSAVRRVVISKYGRLTY
jgi:prepilin-type N-terminal cleavage/methylation domain-containing protein